MNLQEKVITVQDKKMACDCIKKMHKDVTSTLILLFDRHADVEHIGSVEQAMVDLHNAIHAAHYKIIGEGGWAK